MTRRVPTHQFTLIKQTLGLPLMRNVKRGLSQHAEVVKTNFHPVLFVQLLNSIIIQVQTQFKIRLLKISIRVFVGQKV